MTRRAGVSALLLLLAVLAPSQAAADHCGATATVTPKTGPPGTTFVFATNLGAPSDLRLYRNSRLAKDVHLEGHGDVSYEIATTPRDAGRWRAHAQVTSAGDCDAQALFTVGMPDTAQVTARETTTPTTAGPSDLLSVLAMAASMTAAALLYRRRRERPIGKTETLR